MPEITITHVVWDWNGTLLDDVQASVNAINCMLARRHLAQTTIDRYRETFGFPVKDYYRVTGFRLEQEDWNAMAREYHDLFLAETSIRVRPSAAATLEACRVAGLALGLLSASEQAILDRMLAQSGLDRYFGQIMGVDNLHGHSKAERGRDLLRALAAPADHVLFVGDTLHDHEVASQMGCRCLLVAGGHQTRQRLEQAGCPVLDALTDVPAWLERETRAW
jgi:phosphoglycolate phosphatase